MPSAIWKDSARSLDISNAISRRCLLKYLGAAGSAGCLPTLAAPARLDSFARILIDTDRADILGASLMWLQNGLTSKDFLRGLQLAAAATISPYPAVGFKFHAAMAPQSYWLTIRALSGRKRWLPLLWAADYYKRAQAQQIKQQPDWILDSGLNPPGINGRPAFITAMEAWDLGKAETALSSLLTDQPPDTLFDLLFEYGVRDYRDIGHKAIYAANCHRMLTITASEEVTILLRSLLHALLNHRGDANPAGAETWRTASWRQTVASAENIVMQPDQKPRTELARQTLALLRTADAATTIDWLAERLRAGASTRALWDGIILAAGELVLRGGGFIALHANTTANACRYAYQNSGSEKTRVRLLLQSGALMAHFASSVRATSLPERFIDTLQPVAPQSVGSVEQQVFHTLAENRLLAARKLLGFIESGLPAEQVITPARHYLIYKASGVHDFKYLEALVENAGWLSAVWRARYLSTGAFWFNDAEQPDNDVVRQAQSLLGVF